MNNNLKIIKRNKIPKNRRLLIYDGKNKINEVTPWMGWYSMFQKLDIDTQKKCRELVMDNLYWLLGKECSFEDWKERIEDWNEGKHIYGVPIDKLSSMFFNNEEKNIALNSFYNN